jgi:site-specific recombinase XerD
MIRRRKRSYGLNIFTREQVGQLFQFLDDRIRWAQSAAPREVDGLNRDRVMYFVIYAYSLRVRECVALNTDSWIPNPEVPDSGQWGRLRIDAAVGFRGRRGTRLVGTTHASIPELMAWYMTAVRPRFNPISDESGSPLFASRSGDRASANALRDRFKNHLKGAGLNAGPHALSSLRMSGAMHEYEISSADFVLEKLGRSSGFNRSVRAWCECQLHDLRTSLSKAEDDQGSLDVIKGAELCATPPHSR